MKRHRTQLIRCVALGGAAIGLLQSCAMFHREAGATVVGTWKNTAGAVWEIRDDGTFKVDLTADGKPDVQGRYSIDDDLITLRPSSGWLPKSCREKAVYRFERREDTLRFTLVNDRCNMRRRQVLMPWRLSSP